jgi:D-beta-D-heptose 7-phosphate kinase/D-beta-D-heptose 1-phosphate adenosyltransferase
MKELLKQIKNLNIVVIGDVMLDRYVVGSVSRISPEAPVPVLTVEEEKSVAGGASNVALNICSLGATAETVGWFGQDEKGDELIEILEAGNVKVDPKFRFSSSPTITKTRVTASNQQICRVDREASPDSYSPGIMEIKDILVEKTKAADAVIISDYGKGFITNDLLEMTSVAAKFIAIDPKPSRLLKYDNPDLLTPNRFEALDLAGLSRETRAPFPQQKVVSRIFERFAPKMLAITLGSEGMLLARDGIIECTIPTSAREVFDVSGAGDTVIASLTLALSAGFSFARSAEFANLAAGVVVGKVGTATAQPYEILDRLK